MIHLVEEFFILLSKTRKSETERFNHNLKDIFGWCRMTVFWSEWTAIYFSYNWGLFECGFLFFSFFLSSWNQHWRSKR